MSIHEPLFACPVETWLQQALPDGASTSSDAIIQLLIKDLYGENECAHLPGHNGLAPLSKLLSLPDGPIPLNGSASNDLLGRALDTIATDVLHWLQEHGSNEYEHRAPVHANSSLFYHMTNHREDPLPPVLDAAVVTALTFDENDNEEVRGFSPDIARRRSQ